MASTTIKDGFQSGSDNQLKVNSDGSINVNSGGGGTANVNIHDSAGNNLTSTAGALDVNTTGSSTVTGTVTSVQAGLDSFKTSQYTVGTSEIELTVPPLTGRSSISIKVKSSGPNDGVLYSQAPGTVATTGYLLDDGESMQLDLTDSGHIYVVGTASGQKLYVVEIA